MRSFRSHIAFGFFVGWGMVSSTAFAQGYGPPLTMQGVDHTINGSAASRGAGGLVLGIRNDISTMFANPASLQSLQSIQISVGGSQLRSDAAQTQQYGPLKYYSNFSLLMEGLTGNISNPDTSLHPANPTAGDTVQRPYDALGPNWNSARSKTSPVEVFAAIPVTFADMQLSAGVGMIHYADLNWFFQNNNVLSPSILSVNQGAVPLPANNVDSNSIPVQWYQSTFDRIGDITGYGAAISVAISEKLSLGASGLILSGSSTDFSSRVERGRLRFYNSYFRAESVYYRTTESGSSDYTGTEFTLSGIYRSAHVAVGFSLKPSTVITRSYTSTLRRDSTGLSTTTNRSGEDKMTIPLRGSLGLSIALTEKLTFSAEYDIRDLASAEYVDASGAVSNPWLSSHIVRLGVEYIADDWLTLRAGAREQAEVFQPQGNPIADEPVRSAVYSLGAGVRFSGVRLNIAAEFATMKYVDKWASAVSINTDQRTSVTANVSYDIPWSR